MLVAKIQRYGMRNYNDEVKLCKLLLQSIGISKVKMNIYSRFPDKVRGILVHSQDLDLSILKDDKLADYGNFSKYPMSEMIVEYEFILNVNGKDISGYIRLNNDSLRKSYGDIELDIYPFEKVSNFGDLIIAYNLDKLKDNIEKVLIKYPKEFGILVKEAYISVSQGEPSIDLSKRIWIYYSQPFFLIADLINFIKNFKDLEIEEGYNVPKYLLPDYEQIIHKIKPYNVDFLSREFMGSKKFSDKFDSMVMEKEIQIRKGSLILSSNNLENNFLLARELSEKMIFPVMKQVTGDTEFRDILNKSI